MFVNKVETVTRTAQHSMEIDAAAMRNLLNAAGVEIPEDTEVRIYFAVPGGGDWSNTNIDIDAKHPVYVEWTIEEKRRV